MNSKDSCNFVLAIDIYVCGGLFFFFHFRLLFYFLCKSQDRNFLSYSIQIRNLINEDGGSWHHCEQISPLLRNKVLLMFLSHLKVNSYQNDGQLF